MLLRAQDLPKSTDDVSDIEPPLLIQPGDRAPDESDEDFPESKLDPARLGKQLEEAKKNAAAAAKLVRTGVIAKVEQEQRELRVIRLESELAHAQVVAAQEQVVVEKARCAAGEVTQAQVDAAVAALTKLKSLAQTAEDKYHKSQIEAAALNLQRQKQLFSRGSASKFDVARAEKKLAQLQQDNQDLH
jgi:hypothetical protein